MPKRYENIVYCVQSLLDLLEYIAANHDVSPYVAVLETVELKNFIYHHTKRRFKSYVLSTSSSMFPELDAAVQEPNYRRCSSCNALNWMSEAIFQ